MNSGKFIVRLRPELHADLRAAAASAKLSLNELCARRLSSPSLLEELPAELGTALLALHALAGDDLVGIVVFGSWARQESNDRSDIDVLVVLAPGTTLTRQIYRKWESVAAADTRVEPHFVALPAGDEQVSGLWAEVSLDGIVVIDHGLRVQRYLRRVRRLIASGRLVAKRLHGQNYWVHVEVA